jgi:dipeptidyl aminopeptidase/acylaminoacyl peptidase
VIPRSASVALVLWLQALILALPCVARADEPAYTAEQAIRFRRVSGLRFSPDGSTLVCVVSEFDKGMPRTHLWKLDASAGELRPWTSAAANDRAAQWAPDGKSIAFLSNRAGSSQVFSMVADSGEASVRALTKAERGVSAFQWSPDGRRIGYLSEDARQPGADDPQVWDQEQDLERLWILDVGSGVSRRLTNGRWRIDSFSWVSPDRILAQASNHPERDAWNEAIYDISLADGTFALFARPPLPFGSLGVGPGGSRLAYTATRGNGPSPHDLFMQSPTKGPAVDVSASVDRPVKTIHWQNDSTVVFSVTDGFIFRLYRLAGRAAPTRIDLPKSARDFDVAPDGAIAYAGHAFDRQAEVFLRAPDGATRQISHLQEGWDGIRLAPAEFFRFKSFDKRSIEAALLTPASATGKLPLVLLVHGGPGSSFDASSTYWFGALPQLLVAHGYQVLLVNPRGSEAYGEEFLKANRADWGGGDYKDLMAAVDVVIARGRTDPARLGIGGWSYGGYMSQWAPTKTNRFRAAVAGAGTFDLVAEYETEDSPTGDEWYFGTPWEHPERFARSAPISRVKYDRTPTLILHGEADPANPVGQSVGFYRALKRYGVPCELVVYPREGHLPREQKHQVDMLARMVAWFDRYLKPSP